MNKTYNIGGVECRFRDLTLDEAEEVDRILKKSTSTGLSNEETKGFFELLLVPVNEQAVNYGAIRESQAEEIVQDFFLMRINKKSDIKKSFSTLMKKHVKLPKN